MFFRVPSTIRSCLGSDEHRKSSFNMRAQGAPPLQIEKMLTPLMQITDTFIAMPLKALSPKHSHAEARAVAPAGGRREGGGREGGREPQTWSERAAWREGDVIDCSCVRHGSAGSKRLSGWAYSETVVSQGTNYIDAVSKAQSRELGKHSESSKQPRPREREREEGVR